MISLGLRKVGKDWIPLIRIGPEGEKGSVIFTADCSAPSEKDGIELLEMLSHMLAYYDKVEISTDHPRHIKPLTPPALA